jgi:ferrous iron transport protein B
METKREKFIILTLMAIAVPCMSQIAMVTSLLGPYGVRGLGVWAGAIFLVWVLVGTLLNRLLKGESPEIFLEIPPYRCPYPGAFLKKLGMRIKWFVKDALPFVFLGVLLVNILYSIGLVDFLNQKVQATLRPLFGLPAEVGVALLIGFLRKDMAVGMLAPLNLTLKQLIIACVILTMYFPCAASFIVLIREMGIKQMMKALLLMGILTILVGAALNLIL